MLEIGIDGAKFQEITGNLLASGNHVRFQAKGSSMLPFVHHGDILQAAPLNGVKLPLGEIVLVAANSGRVLVHRIIRFKSQHGKQRIQLKGDATKAPDGWFEQDAILGRIVSIQRGELTIDLTTPACRRQARIWALVARWVVVYSKFPANLRSLMKKLMLRDLLPD